MLGAILSSVMVAWEHCGSVEFLFERKCHFKIDKGTHDAEELELEMIDYGIEELFVEDDHIMIYGDFAQFGNIQKGLDALGIEILESGYERIPLNTTELNEANSKPM
ncbi:MAG: YebC/PmpR family DNA-binding transcriptional regulator [Chitinophagales bacterium]